MKVRVLALSALAFGAWGCGNKLTPENKNKVTTGSAATQKSFNQGAAVAFGLSNLGSSLQGGMGNGSGVSLKAMPKPADLTGNSAPSGLQAAQQGSHADAVAFSGCLTGDVNGNATYTPANTAGCTASDFLLVDYANGDELKLSAATTSAGSGMTMEVTKGNWAGTKFTSSINFSLGSGSNAISLSGSTVYKEGNKAEINQTLDLSVSSSSVQSGTTITSTGTFKLAFTDLVGLQKLAVDRSFKSVADPQASNFTTTNTSNITVDTLKNDKGDVDSSKEVAFKNVSETVSLSASGSTVSGTPGNITGEVYYGNTLEGHLALDGGKVVVKWLDGTTSAFDDASLFAGIPGKP